MAKKFLGTGGYTPLFAPRRIVSPAGSTPAVLAPSATVGTDQIFGLDQLQTTLSLPSNMKDAAGNPAAMNFTVYLTNVGGGPRDLVLSPVPQWDANGPASLPSSANATIALFLTTLDGGSTYAASGPVPLPITDYVPKSLIDAKGDLLIGSGDNAVARLAAPGASKMLAIAADGTISWVDAPTAAMPYPVTWIPSDNFLVAANAQPSSVSGQTIVITNTNYVLKLRVPKAQSITGLSVLVGVAATATVSSFYGVLYDSSGNFLAQTADFGGSLGATGEIRVPFSAPLSLTSDQQAYVMIRSGTSAGAASTFPRFGIAGVTAYMNSGLASGVAPSSPTAPRVSLSSAVWSGGTAPATLGNLTGTGGALGYFVGLY